MSNFLVNTAVGAACCAWRVACTATCILQGAPRDSRTRRWKMHAWQDATRVQRWTCTCGELDFPPVRVSRCTGARAALRFPTRHACTPSSSHPLLYYQITRYRSTIKIFELFIIHVCVYIYIYMDIARWILHVVVTTNPRLPIQPVYEKAEFNAGLRVPALNKLDTVILKERRTNHGGLIFSRSRFRLATQPHLPLL